MLASLPTCSNGDSFLVTPRGGGGKDDMTSWKAGMKMRMDADGPQWRVPHITATARAKSGNPEGVFPERMLLTTPDATGALAIAHATTFVGLTYKASQDDVQDRLRTAAAKLDPRFSVDFPAPPNGDPALRAIERALLAGVAATLLLIATSMLIGAVEQLRDRKRILSILVAFGTRRRPSAVQCSGRRRCR